MKKIKIFGLTIFILALSFAFTPSIKAANKMGVIIAPVNNSTFFRGETIYYKAQVTNYFSPYGYPYMLLTKENSDAAAYKQFMIMAPGQTSVLEGTFGTSSIKAGTYYVVAYMNNYGTSNNVQGDYINNKIYIKDFKAPKKVTAKGKKKAVKISFKKVSGATAYQIYGSKKKKGGYKLMATTNKTSYKIKKLKRNRNYYFKVKSVRNVNGVVSSSYSKKVYARTR